MSLPRHASRHRPSNRTIAAVNRHKARLLWRQQLREWVRLVTPRWDRRMP